MNCSECQKRLKGYLSGKIPEDIKSEMKIHLEKCRDCNLAHVSSLITEKVIDEEKSLSANPFLATRIMAKITHPETIVSYKSFTVYQRFLQHTVIAASIFIALTLGILAGNKYSETLYSERIPEELVYLDDGSIESLNLIVTE